MTHSYFIVVFIVLLTHIDGFNITYVKEVDN